MRCGGGRGGKKVAVVLGESERNVIFNKTYPRALNGDEETKPGAGFNV